MVLQRKIQDCQDIQDQRDELKKTLAKEKNAAIKTIIFSLLPLPISEQFRLKITR